MQIINRDALRVTPKKPLIDWVNSIDPVHPVQYQDATHHDAATTYLIEELDSEGDFQDWIKENYCAFLYERNNNRLYLCILNTRLCG